MAHENPLRPDEQDRYGTPVAPETPHPLERDPRDRPASEPAGAPVWIIVAAGLLVAFLVLLAAWALFLGR